MISVRTSLQFSGAGKHLLSVLLGLVIFAGPAWGQVTASITGTVKDTSGAVVPGVAINIKNLESGLTRTAETGLGGSYTVPSLPVGQYEVSAEKTGFNTQVRTGITLVVAQQAVVNLSLEIGNVEQQVTVTAAAPIVNTTLSPTSGLIGEKQVKDLPLNGRSFDQLLMLNVGTANYTSNTNTSARTANSFSVAGRRPEENRWLLNGVDYVGSNDPGQPMGPSGASGQLLGVDAVREFNVVANTYGAEFGKFGGGQVSIVTSSGTNQLHGDAFEYLRNSVLDARNFFDQPIGLRIPPFKRNQFGGALGGPIKRDKVFLFGNYEGFRQRLGVSSVAAVPDNLARQGYLPIGPNNSEVLVPNLKTGILPFFSLWPAPNSTNLGGGVALNISNPPQPIHEDFGLARFDYNMSAKDSLSANYLIDGGERDTPQTDPLYLYVAPQRAQVLGLQETHVFSPTVLNTATVGFSRAWAHQTYVSTIPVPASLDFISGVPPGTITIGGSISGTAGSSIVPTNGQRLSWNVMSYFSWADDVRLIKGRHSWSAGVWVQRVRQNTEGPTVANSLNVSYPSLQAFLQDLPTQSIVNVNLPELGLRTTLAAWYLQDEIKLRPNLTLRLGLRDEMTSGLSEATGRCTTYVYDPSGVIITDPLIGPSCLLQNNAIALWQPRVGLAWDPTGTGKWAVRASAGIYNDLQDSLVFRLIQNPIPPLYGRISLTAPLLSFIPIPSGAQIPPACNAQLRAANQPCTVFAPGGLDPNMHTPTIEQWSFTVEREITKDLMLQVGYAGSEAYHTLLAMDTNVPPFVQCTNPAGCASGGAGRTVGHVPQGTSYLPIGTLPNPYLANTSSWIFGGTSSYHALNVSLVKRAAHGLTFKTNYTFAKILDLNSAFASTAGTNEPQDILNPYNLKTNRGLAAFDLQQQFNTSFSYELPFGHGQRWGSGASGIADKLMGGWQWNGIITAQSGFPFTPMVGTQISGSGDTQTNEVPNRNPAFSGPVILGKVNQWYDPRAFLLPIPGTWGNVARGSYIGPGLFTLDTSLFKKFTINERWSLQFRAEAFNILNRANFSEPNPVAFTAAGISPTAGVITSTATTSRQVQFALKLIF